MSWPQSLRLVLNLRLYLLFFSGLLLLNHAIGVAAQREPKHTVNSFHNPPSKLFFFDDSDSVIYHDGIAGDVYLSQDEGHTWARAKDIPEGVAMMVIEHPFDNKYAFVLTDGVTHYRTTDRGKSWQSFKMPYQPAMVPKPLSFHSDKSKYGYILYQGTKCGSSRGWGTNCIDVTYYTKEAFGDDPKLLLEDVTRCQFAHSSTDFKHKAHEDLIYCVAFDSSSSASSSIPGLRSPQSSRLYSSTDFFKEKKAEDLDIGRNARGVVAFAIVSKFAVVALKDLSPSSHGEMLLYVSVDAQKWAKAQFPHASSATLRENAYTIVESTTHSLAVDVVLQDYSAIGTLFVSNSNGTYFVQSLKDTNRNDFGYVDYERIYGIEGVGLSNTVSNAQDVEGRGASKKLKTYITFDDGSNWSLITPPSEDNEGKKISCDPKKEKTCSLHLHSVTALNNYGRVFSSPAPGLVMGIGSIGESLLPYEECDTFLSTDAGLTWIMAKRDAHKHQIGGLGSVIVVVNDEEGVDEMSYSLDFGKKWNTYKFGVKLRARGLTTLQDSTSQKFLLLGQVAKKDRKNGVDRIAVVQLDFSDVLSRKCSDSDYDKFYPRGKNSECLMGRNQWYKRRKPDADCYVGERFHDPVVHEDPCACTDADYECDYNFIRQVEKCVPAGPEHIPADVCKKPDDTYMGSSGYRKIPGNSCTGGTKDDLVPKKCSEAEPDEGSIVHQTFEFPSQVIQHSYFNESRTILVRLLDHTIWQSSNEGYTWAQLFPEERFLAFYHHKYTKDRAYLITNTKTFYATVDFGQTWNKRSAPTYPNAFVLQVLRFHPHSDKLLWIGMDSCVENVANCRVTAHYSTDNGQQWNHVEDYVRNCAWVQDHKLDADPNEILCESYRDKTGNQRSFRDTNPLELVTGTSYYGNKRKVFDHVVGFAKFSEYLVVAEFLPERRAIDLQVSLDGVRFAAGQFPPGIRPEAHAYTILESSTGSLFFHMTMSEPPAPYWGTILKSNSNGTYFGTSLDYVNRNDRGYVDFEKMIGLDGIALVNIVSNPDEAPFTGHKLLQTRITHNDGSTWKPLNPPKSDALGRKYECKSAKCSLHIHGYTARRDPRATYSSPSVVGLLMAVGNVGDHLAPYDECDTFLSRDGGFTWEEVHKDAHLWEFGDSGSLLVIANDEEPTDHILFSKDEGLSWHEYKFTQEKIRVLSIVTVQTDTSRRFILFGNYARSASTVAVHVDFSALTLKTCKISVDEPGQDDFELWSPSEERSEVCLFGRKVLYHRRKREVDCIVGDQPKAEERLVENCNCKTEDFECEFNYAKNADDKCVLVPGTTPLPDDDSCKNDEDYWYERTPYRKIPFSSCEGGDTRHLGEQHVCPGFKAHGPVFWMFMIMIPFAFTALVGYYYYRRSGLARGTIRLPNDSRTSFQGDSGILATLESVPWFLFGLAGIAWEWVSEQFDSVAMRTRRGYRHVPMEQDAQILRFEDEE
ncbi:Vacuolar protein sorting/targeting protein 10 [Amanita muscaria]